MDKKVVPISDALSSANIEMTVLSKEMFDSALNIESTENAMDLLMNYGKFRTLNDILVSFGNGINPRTTLVDGLMAWQPEAVRENVDRKVRNWLNGRTSSIRKQDAFVLSRILKLSLERTNEFLKLASGEGIHWRDPEDIAWCYAITQDMEPIRILKLLERVRAIGTTPKTKLNIPPDNYTQEVHESVQNVLAQDEDALIAVLESEWGRLGKLHNTAYQLFIQYTEKLKKGYLDSDKSYLYTSDDNLRSLSDKSMKKWEQNYTARIETERQIAEEAGETFRLDRHEYQITLEDTVGSPELTIPDEYSDEKILEEYLYRKLIPVGNQNNLDPVREALQRGIRQNWPDVASLSRMRKRQIDIPRKVLILLLLATDEGSSDLDDLDDEEYTPEESFLDIYTRLNMMLNSCGFLKLDPRSAFDWMILFCISTGDLWESDERIQAMLLEMFPKEN